jgi:succinyl-diaminopimelate desuccinylase
MSVNKIITEVENNKRELFNICSELVKRPSDHPEGRTVECVRYIEDFFENLGISTEIFARNKEKPNIVARIRGGGESKIMWVGHLDVVPAGNPESWKYPPYSGKITSDGKIFGRETSDMKGAYAAAMIAAKVLNNIADIKHDIDFWFTADEEIGGIDGAHWLSEEGIFEGDICIIGDGCPGTPSCPTIDLGCKGNAGTRILAHGTTAHGSRPFLGDNAIDKLLRVIPYVKKIGDYELDIPKELESVIDTTIKYLINENYNLDQQEALKKSFYHPSVSLNILNGGVKNNVVLDSAEAYFDIRLTPGCNPVKVREKILSLVEESNEKEIDVIFRNLSKTAGYYESPETRFAEKLKEAVKEVTGKKPIFKILTGGTDAVRIKNFIDIPCLGFGSSIEGQAHAPNEHNHIDILMMSSKVYATFPFIYKQ